MLGERHGLLSLTWLESSDEERHPSSDMALLIMLLDSMDECAEVQDGELLHQVVEVLARVVEGLEVLCDGAVLEEEQVAVVNRLYTTVEGADYSGNCPLIVYIFVAWDIICLPDYPWSEENCVFCTLVSGAVAMSCRVMPGIILQQ